MGLTGSLPREGRLDDKQTRDLITTIMRQMLSKASIVDLYSLSDPEKCREYVVVTKDALKSLFSEIKVYPGEGEKGVLYFQRIKGMRLRSDDISKQDKYCKDLAFFYVRIFQIFASLALTIFDTVPRDVYVRGKVGEKRRDEGRRFEEVAPGFRGGPQRDGGILSRIFQGGASTQRGYESFTSLTRGEVNMYYIQIPRYRSGVELHLIKMLGIMSTSASLTRNRDNLVFYNYRKMEDDIDNGVLSITQDSIYTFGSDLIEGGIRGPPPTPRAPRAQARSSGAIVKFLKPSGPAPAPGPSAPAPGPSAPAPAPGPPSQKRIPLSFQALKVNTSGPSLAPPVSPMSTLQPSSSAFSTPKHGQVRFQTQGNISPAAQLGFQPIDNNPNNNTSSIITVTPNALDRAPVGRQTSTGTTTLGLGQDGGGEIFTIDDLPQTFEDFKEVVIREASKPKRDDAEIQRLRYRKYEDDFKPHILYRFNLNENEQLIEADFDFETSFVESNYIRFKVNNIKINGTQAGLGERDYTIKKDKVDEQIVKIFIDLYRSKYKEYSFSIISFLTNIGLLRKDIVIRNETDRIRNTNIYIDNPKSVANMNRIPIRFKGEYTIKKSEDGGKRRRDVTKNVEIKADMYMESEKVEGRITYKVLLYFKDYEGVNPPQFHTPERALSETFIASNSMQTPYTERGTRASLPAYLQKVFVDIITKRLRDDDDDADIQYTKGDQMPIPYDSERVDPALKVKSLWSALRQDPPVKAHCVARALQLLNADAIYNPKTEQATTQICNVRFSLIQNRSLPDPTQTIESSHGISVLMNLFFDKLLAQAPSIQNTAQYEGYVDRLQKHFMREDEDEDKEEEAKATVGGGQGQMQSIKEYLPPFCNAGSGKTIGSIDIHSKSDIQELRGYTARLLSRQTQHMGKAVALLFKLFDRKEIEKGGFAFHPAIEEGGIQAVNKVAKEARELLLDYYTDCEDIYKGGLFYLNNTVRRLQKEKPEELQKRFSYSSQGQAVNSGKSDRGDGDERREKVEFENRYRGYDEGDRYSRDYYYKDARRDYDRYRY